MLPSVNSHRRSFQKVEPIKHPASFFEKRLERVAFRSVVRTMPPCQHFLDHSKRDIRRHLAIIVFLGPEAWLRHRLLLPSFFAAAILVERGCLSDREA